MTPDEYETKLRRPLIRPTLGAALYMGGMMLLVVAVALAAENIWRMFFE
jgi:hypothetical protein